jgi:dimethylaniline monooxygenase (N-oxide forming)
MRIAVIGSGISGISAASVLQRERHELVLFEREATAGGVWAHTYPGVTLQNIASHYHISDFPWPFKPDLHPTAEQIQRYLLAAIKFFELDVRLEHEIVELEELAEQAGWRVHGRSPAGDFVQEFDFVLLAVGQYTQPKSQDWLGLPGRLQFSGRIVDERSIDDASVFEGQRVTVVGFGKTAVDMAVTATKAGAISVHHVFRRARWLIPLYIFGLHMSYALFARYGTVMIPSWVHPSAAERFLHGRLTWLVRGFWAVLARIIWRQHVVDAKPRDRNARVRLEQLRPRHGMVEDLRSAAAVAPANYFRLVADGKIEPVHAELIGFDEAGVRLRRPADESAQRDASRSDASRLDADIVVLALGSGSPVFPFLPQRYRDLLEPENDGPQLYRHLLHPQIPRMAFAGYNHGFLHVPSVEIASLWLSALLRGEIELPSTEAMLATIERVRTWKRTHIAFEPSRSCGISTRYHQYLDVMLSDLGLSPYRKSNWFAEVFTRYTASDYAGLIAEFDRRRATEGPLKLRPLPLDT